MSEFTADEAKVEILKRIRQGASIRQAMEYVGKSDKTYEYYKSSDKKWAADLAKIRAQLAGQSWTEVPDFETFSRKYLGMDLFNHQLQWYDMLEGREPRNLHPAQVYEAADENTLLINTPPDHAKSTTISVNYVTWRIIQDPDVRILIVSKTATMAKKFLSAVKDRLSSNTRMFEDMKNDFAPLDGYDGNGAMWRQDMIYVNPSLRTRGAADPTVQAIGIGQHIYGARADLIIMDDCVDLDNAHEFAKQIEWIQTIVRSRVEPYSGKLIMIGTRLKAQDLYSEIRKPIYYSNSECPWTYLTQPAVLEMDEDPANWKTLWPRTNVIPAGTRPPPPDDEGLYPRWPANTLVRIRNGISAENWNRVYMQAQISDTATFTITDIEGCTNGLRFPGPIIAGQRGHRPEGMAGLYVVAGLDPAAVNYTAAVVLGVDRQSGRRYLLDVYNKHGALPSEVNTMMKAWTQAYGIMEWRIETNAYQASIVQDEDLQRYMRGRGVTLSSHITNKNKWDQQWGVATMANLLRGHDQGGNMLELPSRRGHHAMQALVEELIAWYPTPSMTKAPKQDCVMALWFAEIRARELADDMDRTTHWESPWVSERDRENQVSIDLDWWAARQHYEGNGKFERWS